MQNLMRTDLCDYAEDRPPQILKQKRGYPLSFFIFCVRIFALMCLYFSHYSSTQYSLTIHAEIAQLAERRYRKPQVGGSTPLLGSQ